MKTIMFYDTETTGLPLFDQPSENPDQPHIVQAAAVLVDEATRKVIASVDLIVEPDDWSIPDEVSAIHGITTAHALRVGVDERTVVAAVCDLSIASDLRVAHNESFDARILRIAIKRYRSDIMADDWKARPAECTATMATPIMKMAPTEAMRATGRTYPKKPKLTEAYKFFTGKDLDNAHSAMGDVLGCMAVYWAIKDGKIGAG